MVPNSANFLSKLLCALSLVAFLVATLVSGLNSGAAQDTDNAAKLSGRLGGSLGDMRARLGEPSWTDTGLIGYNSVLLNNVDSILVVYYDEKEVVNKISLVYLEVPASFADPKVIADVVAQVAPQDGSCGSTKLASSSFGSEVYGCASNALANVLSPGLVSLPGLADDPGSYSYSIDPTADEYYEIILQLGTGENAPPSTASTNAATEPTTAPEPTAVPSLTDQYPPVADVRELVIGRGYAIGDQLSVSGTVFTITFDSGTTLMQIWVTAPDGSQEAVIVGYEEDSAGIFEGTWITAYGTYIGPLCGTNLMGGEICQPAIAADVVEHV